jgi:hypothetical protein
VLGEAPAVTRWAEAPLSLPERLCMPSSAIRCALTSFWSPRVMTGDTSRALLLFLASPLRFKLALSPLAGEASRSVKLLLAILSSSPFLLPIPHRAFWLSFPSAAPALLLPMLAPLVPPLAAPLLGLGRGSGRSGTGAGPAAGASSAQAATSSPARPGPCAWPSLKLKEWSWLC